MVHGKELLGARCICPAREVAYKFCIEVGVVKTPYLRLYFDKRVGVAKVRQYQRAEAIADKELVLARLQIDAFGEVETYISSSRKEIMSLRFETFIKALTWNSPLFDDSFSYITRKPCLVFPYKGIDLDFIVYSCP